MTFFAKRTKTTEVSNTSTSVTTRQRSNTSVQPPLEKQIVPQDVQTRTRSESCSDTIERFGHGFRDESYNLTNEDEEEACMRAWLPVVNGDLPTSKAESSNKLKFLIRKGVPNLLRSQVWMAVSGTSDFLAGNPTFFKSMLLLVFGPKIPSTVRSIPSFGGLISPSDHYLSQEGYIVLKRILCVVAMSFPDIDFCPSLPDTALMCLMFLTEAETCAMLHVMMDNTKANPRYYLNTSAKELVQSTLAFERLVSRHLWSLHKHMSHLRINVSKQIVEPWFTRMFVSFLPYETVLRIFDIYLNEGCKVLYKVGLAILSLLSSKLMKAHNQHEFLEVLHTSCAHLQDANALIKIAYGFRMKNYINRLDKKAIKIIKTVDEPCQPVYYRPKTPLVSSTILDEQFEILWSWLPRRLCIQDPVLMFSTDVHGCSLSTLYRMCSNVAPSLLTIRTKSGSIFGAYVSDPWQTHKTDLFYGDGECFVFSLSPTTNQWKWSGENHYFMLAANDHIAIGGGSGSALWLNHSFDFCMSSMSETFRNPPLEPNSEFLGAVTLEVFGFQ